MTNAVLPPSEDGFARKKWSVAECRFLVDNGLLDSVKYELIEGEIISKMGQGRLHANTVAIIFTLFASLFLRAVQTQTSIGIGVLDEFNDPEPDVAVLRGTLDDYLTRDPYPATDVLLAVEVSVSTLAGDRTTKANLYARHGVLEYWIVAVTQRELIVHRRPTPGGYADVRTYSETETVAPLAAPQTSVSVASLLP